MTRKIALLTSLVAIGLVSSLNGQSNCDGGCALTIFADVAASAAGYDPVYADVPYFVDVPCIDVPASACPNIYVPVSTDIAYVGSPLLAYDYPAALYDPWTTTQFNVQTIYPNYYIAY